jgi:hypothetical protein
MKQRPTFFKPLAFETALANVSATIDMIFRKSEGGGFEIRSDSETSEPSA